MNQNDKPTDNAIAVAGVSLFGNETQGEAPEWFELSQWNASTDNSARSAEILSHIANDPDCFQQWLDMAAAEIYVAEELATSTMTNNRLSKAFQTPDPTLSDAPSQTGDTDHRKRSSFFVWFKTLFQLPVPVYAGGFAALMLAVLIGPLLRDSQTTSLQQLADRRTDTYIAAGGQLAASPPIIRRTKNLGALFDTLSNTDVELLSFQQGVHRTWEQLASQSDDTSAVWSAWASNLAQQPVDCGQALDKSTCESVTDELTALGQWAFLTETACRSGINGRSTLDDEFWQGQVDVFDQLMTSEAVKRSETFGAVIPLTANRNVEDLCGKANLLLTAGF